MAEKDLKLKSVTQTPKLQVVVDPYIPIKISFRLLDDIENIIYWHTGNLSTTLLEIGIGESSGILKFITLTLAGNIRQEQKEIRVGRVMQGIPVFEKFWHGEERLFEQANALEVFLDDNALCIFWMKNNKSFDHILSCQNIDFYFTKNKSFCGLKIVLNDEQFSILKEYHLKN